MLIKYVPQVSNDKIKYIFSKDKIEVCYKNKTDVFDFSYMPDGLVGDPQKDIETDLEINPFCFVQRKNGVLSIKILNFIDEDATEEECFPEWFEVKLDGKD